MWVISSVYYDIRKGLNTAIELENKLIQEWETELNKAISIADAEYEKKICDWELECLKLRKENVENQEKWRKKLNVKKRSRNIGCLSIIVSYLLMSIIFFFGLNFALASTVLFVLLLVLLGFMLILCVGVITIFFIKIDNARSFEKRGPVKRIIPQKPKKDYFDTVSSWVNFQEPWKELLRYGGSFVHNDHGIRGELNLINRLALILSDEYVCISGLMVERSLDADTVIVGPDGIGVLESKYFSGTISLRNGQWMRKKEYYSQGGVLEITHEHLDDLESQWLRERQSIEKTLRKNCPKNILEQILPVQGGLVFTHDSSILNIDSSVRITCGNINYWLDKIQTEKGKSNLSQSQVLDIVDILINYSVSFDAFESRSSVEDAREIYENRALKISEFCNKHLVNTSLQ